jgi:hypothetical protein
MSNKNTSVLGVAAGALNAYRFVTTDPVDATKINTSSAAGLAPGVTLAPSAADGDQALVAIDGFALVDFDAQVEPYTEIEVAANGKATTAATPGAFVVGYYCPEPVDGAVSAVAANARGRIVIYNYKGRTV